MGKRHDVVDQCVALVGLERLTEFTEVNVPQVLRVLKEENGNEHLTVVVKSRLKKALIKKARAEDLTLSQVVRRILTAAVSDT